VLSTLIKVSAPQVKGAHDADLVLVGERAFIVEHDNDIKPGHGAGKAQYCVLTVVNVKTMSVERVVPMAKSAQAFANETLPAGACFVPRIIKLNDTTLRCFFACEDQSGKSQSQTWYRDFDIASLTFAPDIHRVKLKTSDGTFDMQPQYFMRMLPSTVSSNPPRPSVSTCSMRSRSSTARPISPSTTFPVRRTRSRC
jgi:hypothetical protein